MLRQASDGSITLPAIEARLNGSEIKYEAGPHRDNIGYWMNPADWAEWDLKIERPGKFEIIGEVAGLDGASLEVSAGKSSVKGTVASTGDWGKFETTKFGTLEIPAAGKVTVAVRPVKENWHPLNLKVLRLVPVAQP